MNKDIDKWIAEHVMGWQWWRFKIKKTATAKNAGRGYDQWCELVPPHETWAKHGRWGAVLCKCQIANMPDETDLSLFKPSTNKAVSMTVLERCAEKTFPTVYKSRQTDEWCVDNQTARGETIIITTANIVEMAIALFAKKLFTINPLT